MSPLLPIALTGKPLAVSDDGHLLALEQQGADFVGLGLPDFNSRVVVLDPFSGAIRFETPPARAPSALDPGQFRPVPRTAAFSPRAHHLVVDETKPACPLMLVTTASWMAVQVPSCADLNVTLSLWDLDSGKLIRDVTYKTLQHWRPGQLGEEIPFGFFDFSSIALTDADIAIRTAATVNPRGQAEAITERVALDQDDRLIRLACARLPPDMRAFPEAAWKRALPGEAYRPICEGDTGRH